MNRILDEALCRHSADINAQLADTICKKIVVQLGQCYRRKNHGTGQHKGY